MPREKVTERTFYPALIDVIKKAGGSGVQEISYDSVPDIIFQLNSSSWFLSVKIGQNLGIIKGAFIQYLRHKEESDIPYGILLLLPESIRSVKAKAQAVEMAIRKEIPIALIDAGPVKEEIKDRPFPKIVDFLQKVVLNRLEKKEYTYYSLSLVISLLQQQVSEMMADITLEESSLLRIITDRNLLMDLGRLKSKQIEEVARFLASYILMSQILFLRLLVSARPNIISSPMSPISHHKLRTAFAKVLEINYRPIYTIDVLDAISENFLEDTFDLIWGLEIERVRHELPGRIFHELMPHEIRKMLAAFYTRPQAANILANLTIQQSGETIFDPACGSGTILISAYQRKRSLFQNEGKTGNPHKRFVEEEIFGSDIMPFAVHLTSANLAAAEAVTTIDRTQIIQGDSLELMSGKLYEGGIQQLGLFHESPKAHTSEDDIYKVPLNKVNVILMNPPFTKVERGIYRLVDMSRLYNIVGGEVGLWGHFVALANRFLQDDGTLGAVVPINILRGRESAKVRKLLFENLTPLYILKATYNYGFSEWAEYRDILFIAQKKKPFPSHRVKFCLIKQDLTDLSDNDTSSISMQVKQKDFHRSKKLDIDSHALSDIQTHFSNLMWYCGCSDFNHRDIIINFLDKFSEIFSSFPQKYLHTGFRPDLDVSKILFLTRHLTDSRVEEAFLRFSDEKESSVIAKSPLDTPYRIELSALVPSLRTQVGVTTMDVSDTGDYIAYQPYKDLERVCSASGYQPNQRFNWDRFWLKIQSESKRTKTHLVVARRINPYSPNTSLISFYSNKLISPTDQFNIVKEPNVSKAKALCALFNSALFLAQFFLLKEESTGRYIDVRVYDLYEMDLHPNDDVIDSLEKVFNKFSKFKFPALRQQFDLNFDERYKEFQELRKTKQQKLWSIRDQPIKPSQLRLNFDLAVCQALNVSISRKELIEIYDVFVKEMILTQRLTRD